MLGKPLQVTLRVFMKRIRKTKTKQEQQLFSASQKMISLHNFIHDIDRSVTNYNKTFWNSVPDCNVFFCSDNLWYSFLLHNWPCKTTKLGGFQHMAHDYYFLEKGKRLTAPHHFWFDPLHENIPVQEIRTRKFYKTFLNAEHIFTKLNSGDVVYFENVICLFQNLTVTLSNL